MRHPSDATARTAFAFRINAASLLTALPAGLCTGCVAESLQLASLLPSLLQLQSHCQRDFVVVKRLANRRVVCLATLADGLRCVNAATCHLQPATCCRSNAAQSTNYESNEWTNERVGAAAALIMQCLSVGFIGGTYMKSSLNVAQTHRTRLRQFVALADAACRSQTCRAALLSYTQSHCQSQSLSWSWSHIPLQSVDPYQAGQLMWLPLCV